MQKTCNKCLQKFECKSDDIVNCHCSKVALTQKQLVVLQQYKNCLCPSCIGHFANTKLDDQ